MNELKVFGWCERNFEGETSARRLCPVTVRTAQTALFVLERSQMLPGVKKYHAFAISNEKPPITQMESAG
jgi:hypothetical protein